MSRVRWEAGDAAACEAADRWIESRATCEVVRDNPRRLVVRLDAEEPLLAKRFRTGSGRHPLRERFKSRVGRSPAAREWRALVALREAGASVPRPRALGTLADGDRVLVMEYHEGASLEDALAVSAGARRRLLRALGEAVAGLHAAGWTHGDLHHGNVVMQGETPVLLDLQHARRSRHSAHRLRDLGHLDYSLWPTTSTIERVRLRSAALGIERPFGTEDRRRIRAVGAAALARADEHARSRTRRALRSGRRFARVQTEDSFVGLRARPLDEASLLDALQLHRRALLSGGADVLKDDGRSRITRVEVVDYTVVVKAFPPRGHLRALADLWRGSPARRAWRAGHGLIARRIGAARPLAFLERRARGVPVESVLVLEDLRPAVDTLESIEAGTPPVEEVLEALASLVVALHSRNVDHGDLKATHVFLERDAGRLVTRLLDLEGARFPRRLDAGDRIRALAELNASLPDSVPAALRHAAFARYARVLPFSGGNEKALREIVRQSLARRHRWTGADCRLSPSA